MLDAIGEKIREMANDAQQGPVNRANLELAGTHISFLTSQLEQEKYKNALLTSENEELKEKILAHGSMANLVDIGPCFLKVKDNGERLHGIYCPLCKAALVYSNLNSNDQYVCSNKTCFIIIPRNIIDSAML